MHRPVTCEAAQNLETADDGYAYGAPLVVFGETVHSGPAVYPTHVHQHKRQRVQVKQSIELGVQRDILY